MQDVFEMGVLGWGDVVRVWLGRGSDVACVWLGCGSDVAWMWLGCGLDVARMWLGGGLEVAWIAPLSFSRVLLGFALCSSRPSAPVLTRHPVYSAFELNALYPSFP